MALVLCSVAYAAGDRIAGPLSGRSAVLQHSAHPNAKAQFDRGAVDLATRIEYATLLLQPAPGVDQLLISQQDPSSPDFHRWLTPEQFGDRFGLTNNDIQKVSAWLVSQGVAVKDVARSRTWIAFSGTAGQMNRAFQTEIRRYVVDGHTHFAPIGDLSLPEEFAGVVKAVRGLDDFRPQALYRMAANYDVGSGHSLVPDDLAVIYNIAPLYQSGIDGTGQKIAILGQSDVDLADIRAFRKNWNLKANDPQIITYGSDPGTNGDLIEADLDLEWAGAIARNATLIFVTSQDVELSAFYAIDRNVAPVMSYSFGGCEPAQQETLRALAQQANAEGITWLASSGDSAAATCDFDSPTPQASKGLSVNYPASVPEITAVGGTAFNEGALSFWGQNNANSGSALSYIPEMTWNDSVLLNGIEGAGGGASVFFTKPAWQTGSGVPNDNARDVPDVSFAASPNHDGYQLISGGSTHIIGGTSASTPVFAGIVALLNQSQKASGLGNINPILYRLAESQAGVFHDVTAGDNKVSCQQGSANCVNGTFGYTAANGYDLATGLGSVDASRLIATWNAGNPTTVSVTATPSAVSTSTAVNVQVTVAGRGNPTGTVTFLSGYVTLGTAVLNAGTASLTTSGALVAAGSGVVSVTYSGDNTFAPSSGSVTIPLAISSTASYIVPAVNPNPVVQVGSSWPYTLTLTQKADVATTITTFTIDGVNNLSAFLKTSYLGTFSVSLDLVGNIAAPRTRIFHLAGTDASGAPWAVDLGVPFLAALAPLSAPAMTLTGAPATVQQNPSADPSCQWLQPLIVQETGGYAVSLSELMAGSTDLSSSLSQTFGTTRLAPYGTLTGGVCLSGISAPALKKFTVLGAPETGGLISATFTGTYAAPSASSTTMAVSSSAITISGTSGNVDLNFGGGSPKWTATILGAGRGNWLSVSPQSGSGSLTLNLSASKGSLSNGVYNAILSIQASDTIPQSIEIPVAFVVNGTAYVSVMGVNNAASGTQTFAPGMWMAVYGNNLAPSTQIAGIVPFPLGLTGVSATVNGVAAPIWFVSSGQMNVQIPYETGAGTAFLGINNNGSIASFPFTVSPTAPGIFDTHLTGKAGQTIVAYLNGAGDVTPTLATGTIPINATKLSDFPVPRQALSMTVGGESANIAFGGIVTLVGATQVNFTIPGDLKPGVYQAVVKSGGVSSSPVGIVVTP